MPHDLHIDEGERQMILLALARLAIERPGCVWMLGELAAKLGGREMFQAFLEKTDDLPPGAGLEGPKRVTKLIVDMTEPELLTLMNAIGRAITATATCAGVEKPLFAIVLFNNPRFAQYLANCERSDVIKAMRETADRLDRKQDVPR